MARWVDAPRRKLIGGRKIVAFALQWYISPLLSQGYNCPSLLPFLAGCPACSSMARNLLATSAGRAH